MSVQSVQMTTSDDRARHCAYFDRCLTLLPSDYQSIDTNRVTALYFCLGALKLLRGDAPAIADPERRRALIAWLYALQIQPSQLSGDDSKNVDFTRCGFRGSPFAGINSIADTGSPLVSATDTGNLAMTYAALLCLLLLEDDLAAVNRPAITAWMRTLQQPDGSFVPFSGSLEADLRFVYCACAVSNVLNDFSGVDQDAASQFVLRSMAYDYGFGQGPDQESHGGSTYCAVASLHLMNRLHTVPREKVIRWCLQRQVSGFQGRINKPPDTCYAFWIGASLQLLDGLRFVDAQLLRRFLTMTASKYGGFGKEPEDLPDVLHSYMGLAGLALLDANLDGALNLPTQTLLHLRERTIFHQRK